MLCYLVLPTLQKLVLVTLIAGASAFAPAPAFTRTTAINSEEPKTGSGGMADTRDPGTKVDDDPRKSISDAPSFEDYLKSRDAA